MRLKFVIVFWLWYLRYGAIRCSITNVSTTTDGAGGGIINDDVPFAKLIDTLVVNNGEPSTAKNQNATIKKLSSNSLDYYNYLTTTAIKNGGGTSAGGITIDNSSRVDDDNDEKSEIDKSNIVMKISDTSTDKRKAKGFASSVSSSSSQQQQAKSNKIDEKPPSWIIFPLREGLRDFRVRSSTNAKCQAHSDLYRLHLANQSLWAIQMSESTPTEPIGVLGGTTYQMGNFEECIHTKADSLDIRGRYCLAELKFSLRNFHNSKYVDAVRHSDIGLPNQEASVWEALVRYKRDPARVERRHLRWGFCVPDSCSASDLQRSLNETLQPHFNIHNIDLNVTVDPIYCHTKDPLPFDKGFWITITCMFLLLLVIIFSTLYDGYDFLQGRYTVETDGWRDVVASFSAWRNIYRLGIYNKDSQVKIVNGMKVIMMLLIIYGHSLLFIMGYPQFHPASLEEIFRRGADIALVNTNIVDVFFTVSGFLTFYYGYRPMKVGGIIYCVLSVIFRYLRLIPVFAIVIVYAMYILPYTSDGPIWNAKIAIEVGNCQRNWWLNLLLLNNFVNVDEQCILISWYITTDMILSVVASILTLFIARKPKLGLILTVGTLISSIIITFTITYVNNYDGLMKLYMNVLEDPRKNILFKELYITAYSRAGPYLVGVLTAYLTVKLQERQYTFSLKTIIIGCVLSIAIGEGSQYYGVVFYQYGRPFYLLENALYSCLHRVLFAVLFCWFLLVYLTTGFGIFDPLINHRMFTVLSRITYSVFLMNILSWITLNASMRAPIYYSYKMIMFLVFGDVITTYVLGLLFYLYAEAPICNLSKMLQKVLADLFSSKIEAAIKKAEIKENEMKKNNYGE